MPDDLGWSSQAIFSVVCARDSGAIAVHTSQVRGFAGGWVLRLPKMVVCAFAHIGPSICSLVWLFMTLG